MRILHITNYAMEKMTYQDTELPIAQSKKNDVNRVTVIASDRNYPFDNYDILYQKTLGNRIIGEKEFEIDGCRFIRIKPIYERASAAMVLFPIFKLYKLIKETSPNIIHVHGEMNLHIFLVLLYCRMYGIKCIIDCHADDINAPSAFNGFKQKLLLTYNRKLFSIFDSQILKFIPVANSCKNYLSKHFGLQEDKLKVINLGCKTEPVVGRSVSDNFNFIHSGKFYKDKKVVESIRFIDLISLNNPQINVNFKIVGMSLDEVYENEIQSTIKAVKSKNLTIERFDFVPTSSLLKMYQSSHFGIWLGAPSNSIQDCSASGCIVFLGNLPSVQQMSLNGALTVNSEKLKESADKLQREIFSDAGLLMKAQVESYNMISKYSWSNIADQFIEVYMNGSK